MKLGTQPSVILFRIRSSIIMACLLPTVLVLDSKLQSDKIQNYRFSHERVHEISAQVFRLVCFFSAVQKVMANIVCLWNICNQFEETLTINRRGAMATCLRNLNCNFIPQWKKCPWIMNFQLKSEVVYCFGQSPKTTRYILTNVRIAAIRIILKQIPWVTSETGKVKNHRILLQFTSYPRERSSC